MTSAASAPARYPFSARAVVLSIDNVDTDQIIPARFLKTTDKDGLGPHCFADWRTDAAGVPRPDFPLNRPSAAGAGILVVGQNFGCGSSREHAPWALLGAGFRAVISPRFADIFRDNALRNGLLPVALEDDAMQRVLTLLGAAPDSSLTIDLERQTVALPDGPAGTFGIDRFAKHCLLHGVDQLGFLLREEPAIADYEHTHPGRIDTTAVVVA